MEQFCLLSCMRMMTQPVATWPHSYFPHGLSAPVLARAKKGLVWPCKATINRSLGTCCTFAGPLCCTWLKRSCSVSQQYPCLFCHNTLEVITCNCHKLKFIFNVSQQCRGMTFSLLGSKGSKRKAEGSTAMVLVQLACQRYFIFHSAAMMFSILQLSWVSIATVTAEDFRSDTRSQVRCPEWGTLSDHLWRVQFK